MKRIVYADTAAAKIEHLLRSSSLPGVLLQKAETEDDIRRLLEESTVALIILPENHLDLGVAPPDIPLLICRQKDSLHNDAGATATGLIEYLQPPLTGAKLRRKVAFLLRVGELALLLRQKREENSALQKTIVELQRSLEGHNTFLDLMSRRDGLTGLFNRRQFNTLIEQFYSNAVDQGGDMALVVFNIDYFNEINRSCGQEFGDYVLNDLAARVTGSSGPSDRCFRLSGEDFAILMPNRSAQQALDKAEKLRLLCAEKPYERGSLRRNVTISAGIASVKSHAPRTHEDLINMAHQALFIAKTEGRNRCSLYVCPDTPSGTTSGQNYAFLKDSIRRLLEKSKTSTLRSLQLLAHGIIDTDEALQLRKAREYVDLLSQQLYFPSSFIETFQNAFILLSTIRSLLHGEMLGKSASLADTEVRTLRDLPYKLAEIADLFEYFTEEKTLLLHYGEHYDGSGYPEGLQGEEIPIGARILHLVCAFAAMHSDRPQRPKLKHTQIVAELTANAGTQFDPYLVLKLFDVIEEKGILDVDRKDLDNSRKQIEKML